MKHLSVGEGPSFDISRLRGAAELARQDAERSEWLARRAKEDLHTPESDEDRRQRNREYMQRIRDKDRSEPVVSDSPCVVCGGPVLILLNPDKKLCDGCARAGWRAQRCECGKPLHARDVCSAAKHLRKKCGECRRAIRIDNGKEQAA